MNILYLCDEYPPGRHGGIGTAVRFLAREMVKLGHTVVVAGFYDWGYGGEDYFEDEGVKVYRFRRKLAFKILEKQDKLYVRGIYKIFKNTGIFHYDIKSSLNEYGMFLTGIIHKHNIGIAEMPDYQDYMRFCKSYIPFPSLPIPIIEKLQGGMVFFSNESKTTINPIVWEMENEILTNAKGVISVSEYTANKYKTHFKYKKNINIINNGIDTKIGNFAVHKLWNRVVFTGSLVEKKGIYQLMKAWNIVIEQAPEAILHVLGKGHFSKISSILSPQAAASVYLKGHVSHERLIDELSLAGIAVFPSFAESFALAPMEAMACSTAVINPITTSGPEQIHHGVNGMLVDPYQENDIAEKLIYLLKNPDVCKELGIKGKEYAANHFDINIIAKQHEEYYLNILKNNL